MLVLTRRPGESIVIQNDIVITIVEVRGGQVRIGIDAPRSVQVHRAEVYEQVKRENLAAVEHAAEAKRRFAETRPDQVKRRDDGGS